VSQGLYFFLHILQREEGADKYSSNSNLHPFPCMSSSIMGREEYKYLLSPLQYKAGQAVA
jgi:hypothetical protein